MLDFALVKVENENDAVLIVTPIDNNYSHVTKNKDKLTSVCGRYMCVVNYVIDCLLGKYNPTLGFFRCSKKYNPKMVYRFLRTYKRRKLLYFYRRGRVQYYCIPVFIHEE